MKKTTIYKAKRKDWPTMPECMQWVTGAVFEGKSGTWIMTNFGVEDRWEDNEISATVLGYEVDPDTVQPADEAGITPYGEKPRYETDPGTETDTLLQPGQAQNVKMTEYYKARQKDGQGVQTPGQWITGSLITWRGSSYIVTSLKMGHPWPDGKMEANAMLHEVDPDTVTPIKNGTQENAGTKNAELDCTMQLARKLENPLLRNLTEKSVLAYAMGCELAAAREQNPSIRDDSIAALAIRICNMAEGTACEPYRYANAVTKAGGSIDLDKLLAMDGAAFRSAMVWLDTLEWLHAQNEPRTQQFDIWFSAKK